VNSRRRPRLLLAALAATATFALLREPLAELAAPVTNRLRGRATVAERVAHYGPAARARLAPAFTAVGAAYPPAQVTLLALKQERRLELYAEARGRGPVLVRSYPILAASGRLGPKLRFGDLQVPEGIYPIAGMNPNSQYHLSLKVGYPTWRERWIGVREGRLILGGDIFIHGSDVSIGCLAIGDRAIEELFVLVADCGPDRARVIISPVDFRSAALPADAQPRRPWVAARYVALAAEIVGLRGASGE
jgi:hypothetical protein